jgi:hypothetical protein
MKMEMEIWRYRWRHEGELQRQRYRWNVDQTITKTTSTSGASKTKDGANTYVHFKREGREQNRNMSSTTIDPGYQTKSDARHSGVLSNE